MVRKCNAEMSSTLKQLTAMKLELAKSQADRACLITLAKILQKKCPQLQKKVALEEAEQWRSKCMEVQMHKVPMDVQNSGPNASSCKKVPAQPDQPPPPELLKRADFSPAPIKRRNHLRLRKKLQAIGE